MIKRDRIIMMKRERLKRVTVPNGRRFIARHQRVTRGHLPANLHLTQPYKERAVPKVDDEDGNKVAELVVNF